MIRIGNFTKEEFQRKIQEKKIICFCAGQKFIDLCKIYPMASKVLYVIDNYNHGTTIKAGGEDIPVYSAGQLGSEVRDCILLITSVKYADEIIKQLDGEAICDGLKFYFPDLFLEEDEHESCGIELDMEKPKQIPKCIHYCWFGRNEMPKKFCENIETWKKYCPDYEIVRWDEDNYDISKNRYMMQAYEAGKWGFVPDYARLDIIYRNGGIYLDTDVELLKPLDSLLQFELFCGFEMSGYVALGLGFGAVKNHEIIKDMLEEYEKVDFLLPNGEMNLVASPIYQTRVLERYGLIKNGETQAKKNFIALSSEYLSPIDAYGIGQPTINSFSIHQYAATWFDSRQKEEKNKMLGNYKLIIERMEK